MGVTMTSGRREPADSVLQFSYRQTQMVELETR